VSLTDPASVIPDRGSVIPSPASVIPDLIRDPVPHEAWIAGRGPQ
jgi:hypothetical protein